MALHSEHLLAAQDDKKRKMKTPLQLEVLERVFAEEKYPSEALRARLSIQLGLSNRQLKMWFCHRRLKERKNKGEDEGHGSLEKRPQQLNEAPSHMHSSTLISPSPSRRLEQSPAKEELGGNSFHLQADLGGKFRQRPHDIEERDLESSRRKKSRHTFANSADCLRVLELQAIASVEAQLGEPLRLDSPCLGVEFDPLPSGAFSAPVVPLLHSKPLPKGRIESSDTCRPDSWLQKNAPSWEKSSKIRKPAVIDHAQVVNSRSGASVLQEYQFIPECPTGLTSAYEKSLDAKAHMLNSSRCGLSLQNPMIRGNGSPGSSSNFEQKAASVGPTLSLQGEACNTMMFPQLQLGSQNLLAEVAFNAAHYVGHTYPHHLLPPSASFHGAENLQFPDRLETRIGSKKRKCEEIRVAKEAEVRKKREQKEPTRDELSKWKREEQLQKEQEKEIERMLKEKQREGERLLRDKQREDDRLQRERQREDERLQREARRESERQERFQQKEAQRLEREREKEEARRLKEATRLKTAIERATARRIARECVELIDDERLELLEAAAASQALPSIYLLDGETLQGLDRYKEFLRRFPPSAVKMKKPFMASPWVDSQHNIGNLFMVWRFLIAFADVLGLWPFTLDELVQAFHDYESRLLGEIHIALFKVLVKDIEDMAKASANAGAVNQYTAAATVGGGHTQLVEAAFAWGFDYKSWSRHLNSSTWPEVLRQFSIAAGYGSSIKKQHQSNHFSDEVRRVRFKSNANSSSMKLGITATNAANFLKIKGEIQIRKAGSRLTPGTVKFAAFHVLSVEGSHGLTISEIVARIEKYSLRDFSTSKTPESSVAAALSRDTMFFDRVAPSTYCVKPAYRKNPEDAEHLLQAALERIRLFQSGILDAWDDAKDIDGSEEGEQEFFFAGGAEACSLDGMNKETDRGNVSLSLKHGQIDLAGQQKLRDHAGNGKPFEWVCKNGDSRGKYSVLSSLPPANAPAQDGRDRTAQRETALLSAVDQKSHESHVGQPWVQGLSEGEYSGLSVEERLNALVAVIEAVNEGNTIRIALEDRMELATSLKRQMWAEAQLDKRRSKEEQLAKPAPHIGDDGAQSDCTNMSPQLRDVRSLDPVSNQLDVRKSPLKKEQGIQGDYYQESSVIGGSSEKSRAQLKGEIDFRADELYVFRSLPLGLDRRRNRYWQFMTSHASEDPGCGRIYFESSEDGHWEVIDTEEALDALLSDLDTRGIRESHLHGVLMKLEKFIRQGMQKLASKGGPGQRSTVPHNEDSALDIATFSNFNNHMIEVGPKEVDASPDEATVFPGRDMSGHPGAIHIQTNDNQMDKSCIFERYREFDLWLWSKDTADLSILAAMRVKQKRCSELLAKCDKCHDFYWHEEKHCAYCHITFEASPKEDVGYVEHVQQCKKLWSECRSKEKLQCLIKTIPCRVQLVKAHLLCVEAAIPAAALRSSWSKRNRKLWASSLKDASSPSDLVQLLFELERAIQDDWLCRSFEPARKDIQFDKGAATPFWIPYTTAAVAMRLVDLDSALVYGGVQIPHISCRRKSLPDLGTISAEDDKSFGVKTDVLRDTGTKSYGNSYSVMESRGGRSKLAEDQETGKLKLQGLKQSESTSATMNWHMMDVGSNTVSLFDVGGANHNQGTHQDWGKQLFVDNLDSEVHRNDMMNCKGVKPEFHCSQRKKTDSTSSTLGHEQHMNDLGSNTFSLFDIGGANHNGRTHQDSGKQLCVDNLESKLNKNDSINHEDTKPEFRRSQWKGADSRSSTLSHEDGHYGWPHDGIEGKSELEEGEGTPFKGGKGLPNQRGCPTKKWVDCSEEDETDSMEEGSMDVSVQIDDSYNVEEEDHSVEEVEQYSRNLVELNTSDSIEGSDLKSFDESE